MKLRRLGEEKLLEQILRPRSKSRGVLLPAGDDCAIARFPGTRSLLVLKTDCVVEEVHFTDSTPPRKIGWKAMMRALSDFAAIAAEPSFALITLIVSREKRASWVRELYRGLREAADRFAVEIVGGETSATAGNAVISVTVTGHVEVGRWVSRSGGKANDEFFVTGELGGSLRGHHLNFVPRISEARWLTQHFTVHAMIDLSDGLGSDLPRLARASSLAFRLEETALPLAPGCTPAEAISDGEDYELLFAISPRESARLQREWRTQFPKLRLTRIGTLVERSRGASGRIPSGYVHFQERGRD